MRCPEALLIRFSGFLWILASLALPSAQGQVVETLGQKAMAINPVTNRLYVANSPAGSLTVIDGATGAILATPVTGDTDLSDVAVNPTTNKIYAVDCGTHAWVIDGVTNVATPLNVGFGPCAVAVNPVTNKIYFTNSFIGQNANTVTVLDGATGATATAQADSGPWSLAVNPVSNKIYVANYYAGSVTVIDGATNNTSTVMVGTSPQGIAVNPVTNRVYVSNNSTQTVSVIDGSGNAVTTISGIPSPGFVAVNAVTNKIYVANILGASAPSVTVIDGVTNAATAVAVGSFFQSISVNPLTNQVYVASEDGTSITVIDGATNATTTLPTLASPSVAVNPVTDRIFAGNATGAMTILDGATYRAISVAASTGSAPTLAAFNPVTNRGYVVSSVDGTVTVVDGATGAALATIPSGGTGPSAIAVNSVANKIYVAYSGSNRVMAIDGASNSTVNVTTGAAPGSLAVNPTTNKIYVADGSGVTAIDGASNATTSAPCPATVVAVDPSTNLIYAAARSYLSVIDGANNTLITDGGGMPPSQPAAIAVNPATRTVYVTYPASNAVAAGTFNGLFNFTTLPVPDQPTALALNPVANKVYVTNPGAGEVTVIDGVTNGISTVTVGSNPSWIDVNPATNKIYVANQGSAFMTVIDGATNLTRSVNTGVLGGPAAVAVNPLAATALVANSLDSTAAVIAEQTVQTTGLTASVTPLPQNQTNTPSATFSFSVNNQLIPAGDPVSVYYQVDTIQGQWTQATAAGATFSGSVGPLTPGLHTLYYYAADAQDSTSTQVDSPLTGDLEAYQFLVEAPSAIAITAGNGQSATVNSAFASNLQVKVTDGNGQPLAGVLVAFESPALSCLIGPLSTYNIQFTDANGLATTPAWAYVTAGSYTVTASAGSGTVSFSLTNTPMPVLSGSKTHPGNFAQGQIGAVYTITVSNAASAGPSFGTVTVTENVPTGLTLISMSGSGWTCAGNNCTRSDSLNPGASYPSILATVNVSATASSPQVNAVSVSVGGMAPANATDSTIIVQPASITATSGTPQVTGTFQEFQPLQAIVKDSSGNPMSGVTVTFTGPNSGTGVFFNGNFAITSTTAMTNSAGVATVTPWASAGTGSYQVIASIGTLTAAFSLKNLGLPSLTFTASPSPSVFGAPVTLKVVDSGCMTGNPMTFYDGTTVLGIARYNPSLIGWSITTSLLTAGPHTLRAYVPADANCAAWSTTVNQTVNAVAANLFRTGAPLADGTGFKWLAVGDFNGDGKADLAGVLNGNVSIMLGNGDGTFTAGASYSAGSNPVAIAVGDFNGDGKADLVVANQGSSTVSILLGNGDGTFQPATSIQTMYSPLSVAAGDLNGDGKVDIVVGDSYGRVEILLGNGNGTFQSAGAVVLSPALPVYWVAIADLNLDGVADLVVADESISVVIGNGDGTFQPPVQYFFPSCLDVTVADFNGDGKPDLAFVSASGVNVMLGNGDGTFQTPVNYLGKAQNGYLAVGDFNGDGKADLAVVGNAVSTEVEILLGIGDGTFQPEQVYPISGTGPVVVADFNGDGRADLVVGTYNQPAGSPAILAPAILSGVSATMLAIGGTPQTTLPGTPFPAPLQALVADNLGHPVSGVTVTFYDLPSGPGATLSSATAITNSSGVASVTATANNLVGSYPVTASAGGLMVSFSLNNYIGPQASIAPGQEPPPAAVGMPFTSPLTALVEDSSGNPVSGVTVTFAAPATGASAALSSAIAVTNASGIASVLATANGTTGSYSVTASIVTVSGTAQTSIPLTNLPKTPVVLSTSGSPSVFGAPVTLTAAVTPSTATGHITFYDGVTILGSKPLSAGSVSLSTAMLAAGSRKLSAYYSGDATWPASYSNVLTQTVNTVPISGFVAADPLTVTGTPTSMLAADLNGDGIADLVYVTASGVVVQLGNGNGTFRAAVTYRAGVAPAYVAVADFNGDGKSDLVVTDTGSNNLCVLLGNGDGSFQPAVTYPVGSPSGMVVVADFHRNGNASIATLTNNQTVTILLGNGNGTFQAPLSYPTSNIVTGSPLAGSLAVVDLLGNGQPSLAVGNFADSSVSVLQGYIDGSFGAATRYPAGGFTNYLLAADLNGDGVTDLVAANFISSITVLLGTGGGFAAPSFYSAGAGAPYSGVALGDFNGDGKPDVAVSSLVSGGSIQLLFNKGDGSFQAPANFGTAAPGSIVVADFNGDGRPDVAVASSGGGTIAILLSPPPSLTIAKTHTGSFTIGLTGTYTVTVSNQAGAGPTSGTVTVTENPPAGLTGVSMSGNGWTCAPSGSGATCARSDSLSGGASYPAITVTASVASGASSPQVNSVTVSGGGSASATATDSTAIVAPVCTYSLSPSSATFGVAGGAGSISVTVAAACSWNASTTQTWIAITSGVGLGSGTAAFTVAANGGAPRTGSVSIGGQSFSVSQSAGYLLSTIAGGALPPPTAAPGTSVNLRLGANALNGSNAVWAGGIAVDAAGDVYFSAAGLSSVFKLDTRGILTRVAGPGVFTPGAPDAPVIGDNGPALSAYLSAPTGVALDSSGNLYIADTGNNRIRKVDTKGIITTVAGSGDWPGGYSGDNGPATSAQLCLPSGIAVDGSGNLYIGDTTNNRIRKVDTKGIITTVAGTGGSRAGNWGGYSGDNGPASSAQLAGPTGIALDGAGNLYIADTGNSVIRRISAGGTITTVAGTGVEAFSGDNGPAVSAQLWAPAGVALDSSGNLYVADTQNHRVRKVAAATGAITTVTGNGIGNFAGDNGPAASGQLNSPGAVAVTASGALYISDLGNNRIRKISGGVITTVAGGGDGDGGPAVLAGFGYYVGSVARDGAGNLYVADPANNRIRKVTPDGTVTTVAGSGIGGYSGDNGPAASAELSGPLGVAVDQAGNIYIADANNNAVRKIAASTGVITTILGGLNDPWAVAVDSAGNLYIADAGNLRILKVDTKGVVTTVAGTGTAGYTGDGGPATAAQLGWIQGLAADGRGNLYLSDCGDAVIRKVDTHGVITTYAGTGSPGHTGDGGPATSAQLECPFGLAADGGGNLFFTEEYGYVRQITSSGIISTVAGTSTASGTNGDGGPALSATLSIPFGITVDAAGNLYVADMYDTSIRLLTPVGTTPVLTVASTHAGSFTPGQTGTYTLTVTNAASAGPTSGTVTVTEYLPSWLSIASMGGSGWTCSGTSCTRSDPLTGGSSYPPIAVTVNLMASAPSQVTNQATVSGGGAAMTGVQDLTIIAGASFSKCDLKEDGSINVADVQLIINEALGVAPAVDDMNGDGVVNVADVQIVINAALGLGCAAK